MSRSFPPPNPGKCRKRHRPAKPGAQRSSGTAPPPNPHPSTPPRRPPDREVLISGHHHTWLGHGTDVGLAGLPCAMSLNETSNTSYGSPTTLGPRCAPLPGPGYSAQKPAAERPGPLEERLVDGRRGQQGIDHETELAAAVRGAENDAQEAGDATGVAEQGARGRLDLQESQTIAVVQGEGDGTRRDRDHGRHLGQQRGGSSLSPSRARKKRVRSGSVDTSAPAAPAHEGFWTVKSSRGPSTASPCGPSGRL